MAFAMHSNRYEYSLCEKLIQLNLCFHAITIATATTTTTEYYSIDSACKFLRAVICFPRLHNEKWIQTCQNEWIAFLLFRFDHGIIVESIRFHSNWDNLYIQAFAKNTSSENWYDWFCDSNAILYLHFRFFNALRSLSFHRIDCEQLNTNTNRQAV